MPFVEGSSDGALNGTSEVTLVSAPANGVRRLVKVISIQNRDTAAVTLVLRYKNGGSTRQLWAGTLLPGDTFEWLDVLVLDSTSKSLTALMSAGPTTTNPDFVCTYADRS